MDPAFWHSRWQEGRIGFHQDRPTPLLVEHWTSLGLAQGSRVFVPLCGKSLDMAWLASQGHRVLGVELSAMAVRAFYEEHYVPEPRKRKRPDSFRRLEDRFGQPATVSTEKKYGRENGNG